MVDTAKYFYTGCERMLNVLGPTMHVMSYHQFCFPWSYSSKPVKLMDIRHENIHSLCIHYAKAVGYF